MEISAGNLIGASCLIWFAVIQAAFFVLFASSSVQSQGLPKLCDEFPPCRPIKLTNGEEIPTIHKKMNALPFSKVIFGPTPTFTCMIPACFADPCGIHGVCVESLKSFECVCSPEFVGRRCEKELTKIMITDDRVIYTSEITTPVKEITDNLLDLPYRKIVTNATDRITGVEYDPQEYKIYVAFGTRIDRIHWRSLHQEIFLNESKVIKDLTLDVKGRKLYWVQEYDYGIRMSDMDIDRIDGEGDFLYRTGISNSKSLFFDRFHGNLYWGETLFIARRVDDIQEVIVGFDFKWPRGLFVDPLDERLYWCRNVLSNNIESIRLNGTDRKMYFPNESSTDAYWRTLVYDDVIYWSAENTPGIGRINITWDELVYHPPVMQLRVQSDDGIGDGNTTVQLGTSIDFYIHLNTD